MLLDGENSKIFFDFLKYEKITLKNNIKFIENISNLSIFKNLSKLITFSGTSGLEAIAYGIKPICISRILHQSSILNKQYLPRSTNVYDSLIFKKPDFFKLSSKRYKDEAKKLIYIRENVLTLNQILPQKYLRGDSIKYQNKQFNKMRNDISNNLKYLNILEFIAKKQIFLSKEFGNKF